MEIFYFIYMYIYIFFLPLLFELLLVDFFIYAKVLSQEWCLDLEPIWSTRSNLIVTRVILMSDFGYRPLPNTTQIKVSI